MRKMRQSAKYVAIAHSCFSDMPRQYVATQVDVSIL